MPLSRAASQRPGFVCLLLPVLLVPVLLAMTVRCAGATEFISYDSVVLRGLDKVTARVSTIEAPIGVAFRFGALEVMAESCRKTPPEERPESAAFVNVREVRPNAPEIDLFRGWMFASSPSLSAMDHPVYDIWVLDCANTTSTAESSTPGGSSE